MENVCGLTVTQVTEALASGKANQILIIDCRSSLSYYQGRIVQSVNIHCPPILKRRSGGFISLENIVPCESKRSQLLNGFLPDVIVYDDSTEELVQAPKDSNMLSVIRSLFTQVNGITIRYIIGGYETVRDECPALCGRQDNLIGFAGREKLTREKPQSPPFNEPAEILPFLYLGDVSHSSQKALLDRLEITALLNVSSACKNHFESNYRYMNVRINDSMNADLMSWFPKAFEFIDEVAANNGKVLVHCWAGISRSATICIAYIMQKQGLSLDAAFEYVMTRRSVIDPNLNFILQLQKFEASLKSSHHYPFQPIPPSPRAQSSSMFNFPPEKQSSPLPFLQQSALNQSADFLSPSIHSPLPSSLQPNEERHHFSEMSPSSLSQTAASPKPARSPSRPGSLSLLPPTSQFLPCGQPAGGEASKSTEMFVGSTLVLSHCHPSSLRKSPLLELTQPENELCSGSSPIGVTVDSAFSLFASDITCQSLAIPLDITPPLICQDNTQASLESASSRAYLMSRETLASKSLPQSPISPMNLPLSPLSSIG